MSGGLTWRDCLDLTLAQMAGLVASIRRQQGQAQAIQAYALRVAAWGEAEEFGRLLDQLNGVVPTVIDDADAFLAAVGLTAEQ